MTTRRVSLSRASRAGQGIALVSAMLGVGGALGLPVAGVVAQHADYHVLFWICVAGGAVTLGGIVALVPEPPASGHGRFDLPGAQLQAVALEDIAELLSSLLVLARLLQGLSVGGE